MRDTVFELDELLRPVPEPRRGGTFLYCPWEDRQERGIYWCQATRMRTLRAYRRHWRRYHGEDLQRLPPRGPEPQGVIADEVARFLEVQRLVFPVAPLTAAERENANMIRRINERLRTGRNPR